MNFSTKNKNSEKGTLYALGDDKRTIEDIECESSSWSQLIYHVHMNNLINPLNDDKFSVATAFNIYEFFLLRGLNNITFNYSTILYKIYGSDRLKSIEFFKTLREKKKSKPPLPPKPTPEKLAQKKAAQAVKAAQAKEARTKAKEARAEAAKLRIISLKDAEYRAVMEKKAQEEAAKKAAAEARDQAAAEARDQAARDESKREAYEKIDNIITQKALNVELRSRKDYTLKDDYNAFKVALENYKKVDDEQIKEMESSFRSICSRFFSLKNKNNKEELFDLLANSIEIFGIKTIKKLDLLVKESDLSDNSEIEDYIENFCEQIHFYLDFLNQFKDTEKEYYQQFYKESLQDQEETEKAKEAEAAAKKAAKKARDQAAAEARDQAAAEARDQAAAEARDQAAKKAQQEAAAKKAAEARDQAAAEARDQAAAEARDQAAAEARDQAAAEARDQAAAEARDQAAAEARDQAAAEARDQAAAEARDQAAAEARDQAQQKIKNQNVVSEFLVDISAFYSAARNVKTKISVDSSESLELEEERIQYLGITYESLMKSGPEAFEALQNGLPSNTYVEIKNKDQIQEIIDDATTEYRSLIQQYRSVEAARDEAAAKTKAVPPWRFIEGVTKEDYDFIDGEWRLREQTKKADEHKTEFVAIKYNQNMTGKIGDYNYMTGPVYNTKILKAKKKILLIYNENLAQWGKNKDLSPGVANGVARKIRLDNPGVQKQFKIDEKRKRKKAVVSLGVPVILPTDNKTPSEEKQLIESSFGAIKTAINRYKFDTVYYTCGNDPFEFGFQVFKDYVTDEVKKIIRCQLVSLLSSNKIFYYTGNKKEPGVDITDKLPEPCQDQTGTAEEEAAQKAADPSTGAGAVVKLTVDKQPDKGYLDKILGIYKFPFLGAAYKFVKKLWSKEVARTMHTSKTRLIVPEEFGLLQEDVISHLKNRFPVYFGSPKPEHYNDSKLKKLTGLNTGEIQKNRQALDTTYKGKMRYGILGWSELNSLTGSHRPASEAWFLHTWGVNTNEDDVDKYYVFSVNNKTEILKRYKELLDRMFRVVELSAQYLNEFYKDKKIIIRITSLGMGAWVSGLVGFGLKETIKEYYREKLKQIAENNEEWLIIHHPMYPDNITIDISTKETVENNHDPFGDSPDKVIDEKIKDLKENDKTVTLIVNAWDNGSFIGNGGRIDDTMDGWTVAGGSDAFHESQNIDDTQSLGFQSQNASYLHNIYFSKHLTEEPSLWVTKSGTGGSQQAADPSTGAGAGGKGEDTDLPEGWKSAVDDKTGMTFYWGPNGVSQWERPKLSKPPPPPVIFSPQGGAAGKDQAVAVEKQKEHYVEILLNKIEKSDTQNLNSLIEEIIDFQGSYSELLHFAKGKKELQDIFSESEKEKVKQYEEDKNSAPVGKKIEKDTPVDDRLYLKNGENVDKIPIKFQITSQNFPAGVSFFTWVKIVGDGACFFRSISYFLFGTEIYHQWLRYSVIKYLAKDVEGKTPEDRENMLAIINGQSGENFISIDQYLFGRSVYSVYVDNYLTTATENWLSDLSKEGNFADLIAKEVTEGYDLPLPILK